MGDGGQREKIEGPTTTQLKQRRRQRAKGGTNRGSIGQRGQTVGPTATQPDRENARSSVQKCTSSSRNCPADAFITTRSSTLSSHVDPRRILKCYVLRGDILLAYSMRYPSEHGINVQIWGQPNIVQRQSETIHVNKL